MSNKSNEVREALRRIVDQEGAGCLKDVRRFRSLWLDYVPQQSKDAKLILSAVQEGVGGILLDALDQDDAGKKRSIKRCEQQLAEAYIASDGANFAIREIASAMRMDVDQFLPAPDTDEMPRTAVPQAASRVSKPDRMPGSRRSATSSGQERYPGQELETVRPENRSGKFLSRSAEKETPAKRKRKFPWLLLLLLLIGGAAALFFLPGRQNDVPAVVPPVDVLDEQDEQNDLAGVVPPPALPDQPEEDSAVFPAEPEENEPAASAYEIDTIVSNVDNVTAMVMDRNNTLYYISENAVYNSQNDRSIDFSDATESGAYLAYDPYNEIV